MPPPTPRQGCRCPVLSPWGDSSTPPPPCVSHRGTFRLQESLGEALTSALRETAGTWEQTAAGWLPAGGPCSLCPLARGGEAAGSRTPQPSEGPGAAWLPPFSWSLQGDRRQIIPGFWEAESLGWAT